MTRSTLPALAALVLSIAPAAQAEVTASMSAHSIEAAQRMPARVQALEAQMGSPATLSASIDARALAKEGADASPVRASALRRAVRQGAAAADLGAQVTRAGSMKLISATDTEGTVQATFRSIDSQGELDYVTVELSADDRIVDWTWASHGEAASDRVVGYIVGPRPPANNDLNQLGARFHDRDWVGVLTSIDRIEASVGFDPYLDLLRSIALDASGSPAADTVRAWALDAEPTLANQLVLPRSSHSAMVADR